MEKWKLPHCIIKTRNPSFSIRGYEPAPRKFALILSDNWDNVSDTIYPESGTITPLLETKLDKNSGLFTK